MPKVILLTGATGHLGNSLIPEILQNEDAQILALVRAKNSEHFSKRVERLHKKHGNYDGRLSFIKGDVGSENLGMTPDDLTKVHNTVTDLIHSAASVRFDMSEDLAAQQNINATATMLKLAGQLKDQGQLQRYDHVSTCYVAGRRQGLVYEHENDEGQSFRNSYEWSKCQAEKQVRKAMSEGLPAAIHRPAIIVGEQQSGETQSFNVIYWPLKVYANGWWRTFPGNKDAKVDIVPVDFVSKAIATIHRQPETLGKCFHLAVGKEAPSVSQLEAIAREVIGGPPVRYVPQKLYKRFVRPFLFPLHLTKRGKMIRRGGDAFMPYFEYNPTFDTSNAERALGALKPPRVQDYIREIFKFAVQANFGQNQAPKK